MTKRTAGNMGVAMLLWGCASVLGMVAGVFGPWVELLGHGFAGIHENPRDAWLVLTAAVVVAGCIAGAHWFGLLPFAGMAASAVALALTAHDRQAWQTLQGAFTAASVGWGLDLAVLGSLSALIHQLVTALAARRRARLTTGG